MAVGVMNSLNIQDQLFDGALKEADYWSDEPVILSAGMGFEGIIGWPEVNEETVREAGGSWYGSVMCTNGEDPPAGAYTSTCLLYTSPSPRDQRGSRMPSSA